MSQQPGFGHPGYRWEPSTGQDPADVAAEYVHHRLLVTIRERLGDAVPATQIAEALGAMRGTAAEKHMRRVAAGTVKLTIAEFLKWCHVFGIKPSDAIGGGLGEKDSYPGIYRSFVDTTHTPLPSFESRPTIDWKYVCETAVAQLCAESPGSSLEFETEQVIRRRIVETLIMSGIPRQIMAPRGANGLHIGGSIALTLTIGVAFTNAEFAVQQLARAVAIPEPSDYILVIAFGDAVVHVESYIPNLFHGARDESIEMPLRTYDLLSLTVPFGPTPTWRFTARAQEGGYMAAIWELKNTRQ